MCSRAATGGPAKIQRAELIRPTWQCRCCSWSHWWRSFGRRATSPWGGYYGYGYPAYTYGYGPDYSYTYCPMVSYGYAGTGILGAYLERTPHR
jgi:hypothetical protein